MSLQLIREMKKIRSLQKQYYVFAINTVNEKDKIAAKTVSRLLDTQQTRNNIAYHRLYFGNHLGDDSVFDGIISYSHFYPTYFKIY